jgi:hypothetical protein
MGLWVEVQFTLVMIPRQLLLHMDVPADLVHFKPEVAWGRGSAWPSAPKLEIRLKAQWPQDMPDVLPHPSVQPNPMQRFFGRINT